MSSPVGNESAVVNDGARNGETETSGETPSETSPRLIKESVDASAPFEDASNTKSIKIDEAAQGIGDSTEAASQAMRIAQEEAALKQQTPDTAGKPEDGEAHEVDMKQVAEAEQAGQTRQEAPEENAQQSTEEKTQEATEEIVGKSPETYHQAPREASQELPPAEAPPTVTLPAEAPPIAAPPAEAPPMAVPPAEAPPMAVPPAEAPPIVAPPAEAPPIVAPPAEAPPVPAPPRETSEAAQEIPIAQLIVNIQATASERDLILGEGSSYHITNQFLQDVIRLERIVWKIHGKPTPTELDSVEPIVDRILKLIKEGKAMELAGMREVPKPFFKSSGRVLERTSNGNEFYASVSDEDVRNVLGQLLLDEFKKDLDDVVFSESPYREMHDMLTRHKAEIAEVEANAANGDDRVTVPDTKDAILVKTGDGHDKLYEQHVGNRTVFNLASQHVSAYTTTCDRRVEAALRMLVGLDDAEVPPSALPGSNLKRSYPTRKARYLLRNIREDESVFWTIVDPADAALFCLIFVFEVYLEKELHMQGSGPNAAVVQAIVNPDSDKNLPSTDPIDNPTDADVLFGRGGMTNSHPGNRRFRDIISLHRPDYIRAIKMDKPAVARKIVRAVRVCGGRFLKKSDDGKWYDVGDRTASEKTSQGLRERSNAEKRQRSALREALRIRRQDMNDGSADEGVVALGDGSDRDPEMDTPVAKKLRLDDTVGSAGVAVTASSNPDTPSMPILNYVGTNLAVPLSLGMKEPQKNTVKRRKTMEAGNDELNTAGLPPNAVDEEGNILVTDYDILCGRGGLTNHHKGNKRFRDIVALHRPDYVRAPKIQKPSVARVIVRAIRNGDPPGRFLRKDEKTGKWVDIGDKKAAEKTSQALREKTNEERDKLRRDPGALAGVLLPSPATYLAAATAASAFNLAGVNAVAEGVEAIVDGDKALKDKEMKAMDIVDKDIVAAAAEATASVAAAAAADAGKADPAATAAATAIGVVPEAPKLEQVTTEVQNATVTPKVESVPAEETATSTLVEESKDVHMEGTVEI